MVLKREVQTPFLHWPCTQSLRLRSAARQAVAAAAALLATAVDAALQAVLDAVVAGGAARLLADVRALPAQAVGVDAAEQRVRAGVAGGAAVVATAVEVRRCLARLAAW